MTEQENLLSAKITEFNGVVLGQLPDNSILDVKLSNAVGQTKDRLTGIDAKLADNATSVKSFGAKGDGITDDTTSIQNAINYVATRNKSLFFPSGTYLISAPLILPQGVLDWGLEISGAKSETKYQYLPGSSSTIIKATAVMASMITNRGTNPAVNVAYYNVVKNIVLDGNNLAVRGYINGWQDKFLDSTVRGCTAYGVSFGDLTNLTIMREVTMANNANGFECVGSDSTIWYLDKCTIRENTSDGATISSSVGAVINSTVFEANGGRGVQLLGTLDILKRITSLNFTGTCYWEGNTGYAIEIDRVATGTVSPNSIEFETSWINSSSKAVNIIYGNDINFYKPNFVGSPTTVGYFVNTGGQQISISHDETKLDSSSLSITGTLALAVVKTMIKTVGASNGMVFNNVLKAAVLQPKTIIGGISATLKPEDVAGTVITNLGQLAANVIITLPTPLENYRFRCVCVTAQAANSWRISSTGGEATIYLAGSQTPKGFAEILVPRIGDCIEFTAFTTAGGYFWIATPLVGTWS